MISTSPGFLVPSLDQGKLQLRQRDIHWRAFGRRGASGPWPPFGEGGLGRRGPSWQPRLGGDHMGVAGPDVDRVLGANPALLFDCSGSLLPAQRGALAPYRAGPTRRRRSRGSGATGLSGGSGPMRSVRQRVWGPTCGRDSRDSGLGGGGGFSRRHRFGGGRLTFSSGFRLPG